MKAKKKNFKPKLLALFCGIIVLLLIWLLLVKFEGETPSISLDPASSYIGKTHEISVSVSDIKSGVKKLWIGLIKEGKERVVFEKEFPRAGLLGAGKQHQATFNIQIDPRKLGLSDGKAMLRMVASDFSWRKWWHGNRTYIEKEVTIDTKPPEINMLSRVHNVSQGGSGLVTYRLSEPCQNDGVYVGSHYFPGHAGYFKDRSIAMAFFAVGYNQGAETDIFLQATDFSGNVSRSHIPHYFKKKGFKKDVVNIPDSFLKRKMVEFGDADTKYSEMPLIEKFLKVNRELRRINHGQIDKLVEQTDVDIYWEGAFSRLPNSARKSGFADDRKYKYKGKVIDRQVHLGIDLASIAHSPIPAANRGKIVFTGDLGIYGKTVMIDHGFGLFSTYSHLSSLNATQGQMVAKGDIIGHTGSTGLAGGDHLHFGILINRTFVNPIEWWDGTWIKNNIVNKINDIKSSN
ncbi:MAG: M23 family metallopeptidase [Desulfobacterales bacterium]|nr:MAG: M23 family metallopeptidase [Desulfobacterales bacterium]